MTFLGATDGNYRNLGTIGKSWPCKAHFFVCFRSDVGDARGMISEQPWFVHRQVQQYQDERASAFELRIPSHGSAVLQSKISCDRRYNRYSRQPRVTGCITFSRFFFSLSLSFSAML